MQPSLPFRETPIEDFYKKAPDAYYSPQADPNQW